MSKKIDVKSSSKKQSNMSYLIGLGLFTVGYESVTGMVGQLVAPTSVGIAAGTMAIACAIGAAALIFPYFILKSKLNNLLHTKKHTFSHFFLNAAINVGLAYSSAFIGATCLGLAAAPIVLCTGMGALVLEVALPLVINAGRFIFRGAVLLGIMASGGFSTDKLVKTYLSTVNSK